MVSKEATKYFFITFFKDFYVYESRRTLITGSKDYNIYKGVIETFLEDAISDNSENLKNELCSLENSFYENYTKDLLVHFKSKIDATQFEELKNKAVEKKYLEVISTIEEKFDFVFNNQLNLRTDDFSPNSSCITTVSTMKKSFEDFIEAKKLLQEHYLQNDIIDIDLNTEEYFILKVIYSEFWNFLSHISFALSYDEGVQNYESNLTRATRHIERAILDIYKFIIVNHNLVDEEILKARNEELRSFGNVTKISKAYDNYKELITNKLLLV